MTDRKWIWDLAQFYIETSSENAVGRLAEVWLGRYDHFMQSMKPASEFPGNAQHGHPCTWHRNKAFRRSSSATNITGNKQPSIHLIFLISDFKSWACFKLVINACASEKEGKTARVTSRRKPASMTLPAVVTKHGAPVDSKRSDGKLTVGVYNAKRWQFVCFIFISIDQITLVLVQPSGPRGMIGVKSTRCVIPRH